MVGMRYWVPHRKTRQALSGYPIYGVPHPQSEETMDPALVRENFDYFMSVRLERLAAFQAWLKRHFGVEATLDENGICAVDAWEERYGGGVVPDNVDIANAFYNYFPAWEGDFIGCNVIVDLAIFIGEYLISQRNHLRWICSLDCLKYEKRWEVSNLGRPHIGGFPSEIWTLDVFQMGKGGLLGSRQLSQSSQGRLLYRKHVMIQTCKQTIKRADTPNDDTP